MIALGDPTLFAGDSDIVAAPQSDDYAADQIALLGDGPSPDAAPADPTTPADAAAGAATPAAAPTTAAPVPTAAQDAVFTEAQDTPFTDPLSADPLGADTPPPSAPVAAGPAGPIGAGSGGQANGPAYAASSLSGASAASGPSGPSYASGPSGPTYTSGPSGGSGPSGPSSGTGPTGPTAPPPPTWINGPSFTFTAPAAPSVNAPPTQTGAEGAAVSLAVQASDPNVINPATGAVAPLSYDAVGLPTGLTINHTTGVISGTVGYDAYEAVGGAYTPTIVVADSLGASSSAAFTWNVTDSVRPPAFPAPTGNQSGHVGDAVSLQVNASQPDGDQLIYDDGGTLPSGLTIDSLSGLISGTVADDAASSYNVTLTAADDTPLGDTPAGNPVVASESFVWTVGVLHDPSLSAPASQVNAVGGVVSLQLSATDAPGNTLTYGVDPEAPLPDGLSLDAGSGVISGTIQNDAARSTPYAVTVTASDGPQTASATFQWTVNPVGVTNPGGQDNTAGDAVSLSLAGDDAAGLPLTYSAVGLPQGLSISPTGGVISGTIPLSAASGQPYDVTVTATDGQNSGSTTFAWEVDPLTLPDRTDVEGATVSFQTPEPYPGNSPTYGATNLPNGVTINASTGVIGGAIADGDSAGGPYAVAVTTTYAGGSSSSQGFNWTIQPTVNGVPTLAPVADQSTVAGTPVSLQLSATDSSDEDFVTYSAAGLPDGLTLGEYDGLISGTPADDNVGVEPYVVTVTADDGHGNTATRTFNWTVTDSSFTLNGMAISQTEGAGVQTFAVATFTDPDTNRGPGDYSATISWGDGQTSSGSVDGAAGAYTVSGDHVYLHPGSYTVTTTVTDPAGVSVSSSATASVASAALTATGGFVDGTTAGSASTFTVATFSDPNTYDAAGSYTATIHWGDGATTQGVIDGADGEFRVTGTHAYAADGTYTVGVTITDADGTTATASGTVTAGDLVAGVTNTVTVAAFTDANAAYTASSFHATLTWGNGLPVMSATVTKDQYGNYEVAGTWPYGAAGTDTIVVTVTDPSGQQITASHVVLVAPAPAVGYGGPAADGDGGPLALFAAPVGYGGGSYTATADWGDGTTSAVELDNAGSGIIEAVGGHDYAAAGTYGVTVRLFNPQNQLVAAAVEEVTRTVTFSWRGPDVVPGNSIYSFHITMTPTKAGAINPGWEPLNDSGGYVHMEHTDNAAGLWTGFDVTASFFNKPAVAHITLQSPLAGAPSFNYVFTVVVVQVNVDPGYVLNDPKKPFVLLCRKAAMAWRSMML